jgi:hypothetical protein
MEYYIISLIISIVVFIFVYLCDYKKPINNNNFNNNFNNDDDNDDKSLFTKNNLLLFGIIYIVITIICFYVFTSSISLYSLIPLFILNLFKAPEQLPPLIKDNGKGDDIDPKILNKINDNFDIGFNPPNNNDNNDNINDNNDNINNNTNDNDNTNDNIKMYNNDNDNTNDNIKMYNNDNKKI